MQRADVVVVGGGPAGASCAGRLVAAGLQVVVVDRARFPRDKPCAGWITPEVVEAVKLVPDDYGRGRTLQAVSRFQVGWIGGEAREVSYDHPVSYGILRREFDSWLLERSRACLRLGEGVSSVNRARGRWVVNDMVTAPLLVGAGGHFCPVARMLKGPGRSRGVVVAQEMEMRLSPEQAALCRVAADRPELDFASDFSGYGWCFRKGEYLNVGLGKRDPQSLAADVRTYLSWLENKGRIPMGLPAPLHGHAYRLREGPPPRVSDDGVLLVGDAAGLAHAASGEGILPAILSGQVASDVLLEVMNGRGAEAFESYPQRLAARIGPRSEWTVPGPLRALAGKALLGSTWLTRRVVLDRFFLHRRAGATVQAPAPVPAAT
ncbi:MAG TPA: NAD(P)/FAD-dependent oxidoreductase [Vicinamibacteria bacterium]|nr:NAD(P)/FAD-dependent oxidoreductase [Vicinamibacteria bacterium]